MAFVIAKSKTDILQEKEAIISDKKIPLAERVRAHQEIMKDILNPVPDLEFDPATFDPMSDDPDIEVKRRPRQDPHPRLPTMGMKPKQLMEGQMVGMFESKQDLYLTMAYFINDLLDRIEVLERKNKI